MCLYMHAGHACLNDAQLYQILECFLFRVFFSVAHQALVNTSKILHESIVLKYRRTDGFTGDCLRLL